MFQYNFVNSHKATIALVVETPEAINGDNYVLGRVIGTTPVTPWELDVPPEADKEAMLVARQPSDCVPWMPGKNGGEVEPLHGTYNDRLWFVARIHTQAPYQQPQYQTALLYIPDYSLYRQGGLDQIAKDLNEYLQNPSAQTDPDDSRMAIVLHHEEIELSSETFISRLNKLIEEVVYAQFKTMFDIRRQHLEQLSIFEQLGYGYTAPNEITEVGGDFYEKENPIIAKIHAVTVEESRIKAGRNRSRAVSGAGFLRFFFYNN